MNACSALTNAHTEIARQLERRTPPGALQYAGRPISLHHHVEIGEAALWIHSAPLPAGQRRQKACKEAKDDVDSSCTFVAIRVRSARLRHGQNAARSSRVSGSVFCFRASIEFAPS